MLHIHQEEPALPNTFLMPLRNNASFEINNTIANGLLYEGRNYPACPLNFDTAENVRLFLLCTNDSNLLQHYEDEMIQLNKMNLISPLLLSIIIFFYVAMIIFGSAGNLLVVLAVALSPHMRTPRNVFIVNLAISDLTLCLFTQPFSLLRLLSAHQPWTFGNVFCKIVNAFQGTNIFVSTISITAIALDRFQVIVYPTRTGMKRAGIILSVFFIWFISFIMASPLTVLSAVRDGFEKGKMMCGERTEKAVFKHAKVAYSIFSLFVQYVVPLVIVSIAYGRICIRIKSRMTNQQKRTAASSNTAYAQQKQLLESQRQRRTNVLLGAIALIFALSWIPLNIVNIVMDAKELNMFQSDKTSGFTQKSITLIQTISLLLVLSSACSNPVLYGWLNENFNREFKNLLKFCCPAARTRSDLEATNAHKNGNLTQAPVTEPLLQNEYKHFDVISTAQDFNVETTFSNQPYLPLIILTGSEQESPLVRTSPEICVALMETNDDDVDVA